MGARLIKIASLYFIIGVGFGMFMSMSHNFAYTSVHAHINLVGWASMALAGLVYHNFPKAAESILGKLHFWCHNLGLPIMMIALIILVGGNEAATPFVAAGGTIMTIAVILFVINVFMNVSESRARSLSKDHSSSL